MHDNMQNPFDPKFYQQAFDTFDSIADEHDRRDDLLREGISIPDADGARSSEEYKNAITTNSFNLDAVKESLFHIYENSSHKLIASNHDTTGFYSWHGHMSDMKYSPNTEICEIHLPTKDILIEATHRDQFKQSQYYRTWVKLEDLLNHHDIFPFTLLLFIDRRIYSEYEFYFDDQEIFIRFKYNMYWRNNNYPVYLYKVPTNAQCRVKISRELCENQWKWKLPVSYLSNPQIQNSNHVIITINRIGDPTLRKDRKSKIEVLGDNLEFLPIENGIIDLDLLSNFNKSYIRSEYEDWIWMSVIVPKYFFEFPILNTVDSIYKAYKPKLYPVVTKEFDDIVKHNYVTKDGKTKQVFIDWKNDMFKEYNGWDKMIRPIVLSDAHQEESSADQVTAKAIKHLRDLTVVAADHLEDFRFLIKGENHPAKEDVSNRLDQLTEDYQKIYDAYYAFIRSRGMEKFDLFSNRFEKTFKESVADIRKKLWVSEWVYPTRQWEDNFWKVTSELITIPRELADRYMSIEIIHGMRRTMIFNVDESKRLRFQRPIEEHDFWIFEYDIDDRVWRPSDIVVEHHFPDVYLLSDPVKEELTSDRIFKSFLFYSDTANVRELSSNVIEPTSSWENDTRRYYLDNCANYRDIFMEKFYWMGLRSIYNGVLQSKYKWELLEYIANNPSFERFNQLFLRTMDPYFRMGLATYLKSDDHEFPFDYNIHKLEESMQLDHLNYNKISNFEIYLDRSWIPSYFDYMVKVMKDWDPGEHLIRRPPSTFDIRRLQPALYQIQKDIVDATQNVLDDLNWILKETNKESYQLNLNQIEAFKELIQTLLKDFQYNFDFINDLDPNIFSINDINQLIANLNTYFLSATSLSKDISALRKHVEDKNIWSSKRETLKRVRQAINGFKKYVDQISALRQSFDLDDFMRAINDLRSYLDYAKTNPEDQSVIGQINKFDDPWTVPIKDARNKLFVSTTKFYASFDPKKSYTNDEVTSFVNLVDDVKDDIHHFKIQLNEFWRATQLSKDQNIIDRLDHITDRMSEFRTTLLSYYKIRSELRLHTNEASQLFDLLSDYTMSQKEYAYERAVKNYIERVLKCMSYIVGTNRQIDAQRAMDAGINTIDLWLTFNGVEESIFTKLLSDVKEPSEFLEAIYGHIDQLKALIGYMETVNEPFIPDTIHPTYSDVYEVNQVKLDRVGIQYDTDDTIFVPKVGPYKITADGENHIEQVIATNARRTTFRDPMAQQQSYHSTSTSNGVGATIKVVSSKHQRIINDDVIIPYLKRIRNVVVNIKTYLNTSNPYNNHEYKMILDKISQIQEDWNHLNEKYHDYMSETSIWKMNSIIKTALSIITPSEEFMSNREKIDPHTFFIELEKLLSSVSDYVDTVHQRTQNFSYYDEQLRVAYAKLNTFIGTGSTWSDEEDLKTVLFECKGNLKTYQSMIINSFTDTKQRDLFSSYVKELFHKINVITEAIDASYRYKTPIQTIYRFIEEDLSSIQQTQQKDSWYRIDRVVPARQGKGYRLGDIVEVIPAIDPAQESSLSQEMKDIILNDKIYLQITEMRGDHVGKLRPLLNYALPYMLWGIRELTSVVGNGVGLTVDFFTHEVGINDSTILYDDNSYSAPEEFYQDNDLIAFDFENIHDINIGYDVFLGGKQTLNFYQRHNQMQNHFHPRKHDTIYINANEVMKLSANSIYIPGENYFIYKVNAIDIRNHGSGYAVGQTIYANANEATVKLRVSSLGGTPYKGISKVVLPESSIVYGDVNPSIKNTMVVTDDMNNIDDEYAVTSYDQITSDGVKKPATLSYPQSEYEFISRRQDRLRHNDRNEHYMYREIDMIDVDPPANEGDYEHHWYQGSRIDNSQVPMINDHRWEGIYNIIPPADPFLPDERRLPPNLPTKGEYQSIGRVSMHSKVEVNLYMTSKDDHVLLPYYGGDVKFDFHLNALKLNGNHFKYHNGIITLNLDYLRAHTDEIISLFYPDTTIAQRDDNPNLINIPTTGVIFDDRHFVKDKNGTVYLNVSYLQSMEDRILKLFHPEISLKMDSFEEDHEKQSMVKLHFAGDHFSENDNVISLNLENLFLREDEHNESYERLPIASMQLSQIEFPSTGGSTSIQINIQHYHRFDSIPFIQPHLSAVHSNQSIIPSTGGSYNFLVDFKLHRDDIVYGEKSVLTHDQLPVHISEWPDAGIGKSVIVEHDAEFYNHRTKYTVRSFMLSGFIRYHAPEYVDMQWNNIQVDWCKLDYRPDLPGFTAQYHDAPWNDDQLYHREIISNISDGLYPRAMDEPKVHFGTFIHHIQRKDLSIFNWTTRQWENLNDHHKWNLELYQPIRTDEYPNVRLNGNHFIETSRGVELNVDYLMATIRDILYLFGKNERVIKLPTANPFDMNTSVKFNSEHFRQNGETLSLNLPNIMAFNVEIMNLFGKHIHVDRSYDAVQFKNIVEFDQDYFMIDEHNIVSLNLLKLLGNSGPIQHSIKYGFRLTYHELGFHSYDMEVFLNKIPDTQKRNARLKQNATMDIGAHIVGEVNRKAIRYHVNTGNHVRIRKIFPYEQRNNYHIGGSSGYIMDFKLAPYIHFKNQILLQDVKIFNKTAERFEDLLDLQRFEVQFKDPTQTGLVKEINTRIVSSVLGDVGEDFVDGPVWGWNEETKTHIFGDIITDLRTGHIQRFRPHHCQNPPKEDMIIEFILYQNDHQTVGQSGSVLVEFKTEDATMNHDGYIHHVTNPFAPVPEEIRIIAQFSTDQVYDYDIIIDKKSKQYNFYEERWISSPTFRIPKRNVPTNQIYILTEHGRLPRINPSTRRPTFVAKEDEYGTSVTFLGVYRPYQNLSAVTTPYTMQSVYTLRKIPSHGYINLQGKINKPLNHKYFEFWVNGRLLTDEVTIISPTKLFLHGLQSLKNFEIIEINRDPNEYFSDIFLKNTWSKGRPFHYWDYTTYIDAALEGNLKGDNYTKDEQESLLTPVWNQVSYDHPSFEDYPPNTDNETDIMQTTYPNDHPDIQDSNSSFQYMVINPPTLEGEPFVGNNMQFEQFGLQPISNELIIDLLNDEWEDEIKNDSYFHKHIIMDDDQWYGVVSRMYTSSGEYTDSLDQTAYHTYDDNVLHINRKTKRSDIIHDDIHYDLD